MKKLLFSLALALFFVSLFILPVKPAQHWTTIKTFSGSGENSQTARFVLPDQFRLLWVADPAADSYMHEFTFSVSLYSAEKQAYGYYVMMPINAIVTDKHTHGSYIGAGEAGAQAAVFMHVVQSNVTNPGGWHLVLQTLA